MKNRLNNNPEPNNTQINYLLGIALDNDDGHKRLTRADKFSIVGGSEETHDRMTETLVKTFEDLSKKGKELEQAEPQELADLIQKNSLD